MNKMFRYCQSLYLEESLLLVNTFLIETKINLESLESLELLWAQEDHK